MTVLGIDFNTNQLDLMVLDEDTGAGYPITRKLTGPTSFQRARRIPDAMPSRSQLEAYGVRLVGIELPVTWQVKAAGPLMRAQGAILASLPANLPVVELTANEWLPIFAGQPLKHRFTSSERKAIAFSLATSRCPSYCRPETFTCDQSDAYGIAYAAMRIYDGTKAATAA